jgi:hypothetical protein
VVVGDVVAIALRQSDDDRRCVRRANVARVQDFGEVVADHGVVVSADAEEPERVVQAVVDAVEGCPGVTITQEVVRGDEVFRTVPGEDHHARVERVQSVVGET